MARALIEQRRSLAWNQTGAGRAHCILTAVTARPDEYFDDPIAYLTAIWRFGHAIDDVTLDAEMPGVLDLLRHAALRLEHSDLGAIAQRLKRAQNSLARALDKGADEQKIAEALRELRKALTRLCYTNSVWDSAGESNVATEGDEHTRKDGLQDHELA